MNRVALRYEEKYIEDIFSPSQKVMENKADGNNFIF